MIRCKNNNNKKDLFYNIHIRTHTCMGYSINSHFVDGVSSRKQCFSRESTVMGPFMSQKTVCITFCLFVAASHQTRLDTWSKAQRPIKVGIKGRGRSGTSRESNPAGLCCSSAHMVQCEPDKASSFTNPNLGPGTYALWITFCTYFCVQNFFFNEEIFRLRLIFNSFENFFFAKTCFSINIIHSFVNFTWFAFSSKPNIRGQTFVQAWRTLFWLPPF